MELVDQPRKVYPLRVGFVLDKVNVTLCVFVCEEGAPADVFGNPQKQETRDFLSRFRGNGTE